MTKKDEAAKTENDVAAEVTAQAQQLHDIWVHVELTRADVNPQDQRLCTWDLLPDVEKDRYREIAMRLFAVK